jgi:mono/diheme cytochrome c family protein
LNFPGEIYPGNLTPTGKASWTNEDLYKAITMGIHKDGHALFPIMPYMNYRTLDKQDILDVIAYIRTVEARENNFDIKPQELDFPLNLIVKTMPQETAHQKRPDPSDQVAYGKYLLTAASCMDCHTPQDKGQFIMEKMLAGGMEFKMENGKTSVSANITPDEMTGIGNWTEEQFVKRFKSYADTVIVVGKNDYNTEMPWGMYAGMKEGDLKAIYAYLRTVNPVENAIVKFK